MSPEIFVLAKKSNRVMPLSTGAGDLHMRVLCPGFKTDSELRVCHSKKCDSHICVLMRKK